MVALIHALLSSIGQASVEAKPKPKPYQWRVIAPEAIVSRLVEILEGCLVSEVVARWTVSQVIDALTVLRRDVGRSIVTSGAGSSSRLGGDVMPSGVAPSPPATSPVVDGGAATYDTLALLSELSTVGVEDAVVAAVADVIGHLAVSPLGVLKSCGVAAKKGLVVRRRLTPREDYALVGRIHDEVVVDACAASGDGMMLI